MASLINFGRKCGRFYLDICHWTAIHALPPSGNNEGSTETFARRWTLIIPGIVPMIKLLLVPLELTHPLPGHRNICVISAMLQM